MFDDLGLRIAGLLDDEVALVALDYLFRVEEFVAVEDREPARVRADALVFGARQIKDCETAIAHGNGGVLSTQATVILGTQAAL